MIIYNVIDLNFTIKNKRKISAWVKETIQEEYKKLDYVSFNFCTDEHLLKINNDSLQHDYYTDIITFELNEPNEPIEGDLYISVDRIKENAKNLSIEFTNELHRVIIHGILHLCGYKDKTKKDAQKIREKENYYLNKL